MNLYEITGAMAQLESMEDVDAQTLADTLESLQMEFDEKLSNIGRWVRNLEAEAMAIKSEEERLYKKRKALENKVISLKEYVRQAMIATGCKKTTDGVITWGIQSNPARVVIDSEDAIPLSWYSEQVVRTLNKNELKQALQGGHEVPGCHLEQEQGVRLK